MNRIPAAGVEVPDDDDVCRDGLAVDGCFYCTGPETD